MELSLKSFSVRLAIFSLFTFGILFLWQRIVPARFQSEVYWAIWIFFIASTALIHAFFVKAASKDPKKFVTNYMGITGIKLFLYLIIIIIYGLLNRDTATGFILCFLIMYFFYSVFEVVTLLKFFKK